MVAYAWTKLTSLYEGRPVCEEQVQGFVASCVVRNNLSKSQIIGHVKEELVDRLTNGFPKYPSTPGTVTTAKSDLEINQ